jgi:hypothetical protein
LLDTKCWIQDKGYKNCGPYLSLDARHFVSRKEHGMIKVIGVDPGLSATGVGIVRGKGLKVDGFSFGSIHTSKNLPLPSRLDQIFSNLLTIL